MACSLSKLIDFDRIPERNAFCGKHGAYVSKNYIGSVWSSCPECAKEKDRLDKLDREREVRKRETDAWLARIGESGIPPRFRGRGFDSFIQAEGKTDAFIAAKTYADNFAEVLTKGRSLVFVGEPGVGKTHLACAIGLNAMQQGYSVIYTTVPKMMGRFSDTWRRESHERHSDVVGIYAGADLLILDEIGMQLGLEHELVKLFEVINERYERVKPTIVISNLDRDGTMEYLGGRIWDRLRENGGALIAVRGQSMRGIRLVEGGNTHVAVQ